MTNYKYCLCLSKVFLKIESDYEIFFRNNTAKFLINDEHDSDYEIHVQKTKQIEFIKPGIKTGDRFYADDGITNDFLLLSKGGKYGFHSQYIYETNEWNIWYTELFQNHIQYIDVLLGYIGIENILRYNHGLFLHSSLIKWNEVSILFSAPSGTGKSTQADLWVKYKGASIINGDRACVRKTDKTWYAFGSPYAGSSGIYVNDGAPIKALFLLRQAPVNKLIAVNEAEAVKFLFPEIVMHHWDPYFVNDVLQYLTELIHDIPVFLLECTPDINAVNEVMKVVGN